MPNVSVIIPTYNRSKSIGKTIESVLNQTYNDFEIIIVDDNSSDNTNSVINSFLDSRIKYIRHNENKGAPAARNTGIKNSKGMYIALLDDDDEWYPKKLEEQVQLFNRLPENVGMLYSGHETVDKYGNIKPKVGSQNRGNLFYLLLNTNFIGSPTNLIKKECFDKIGYCDESLQSCQDWDLWIRISKYYKIEYIPDILARRNVSDVSISNNIDSVLTGHKQILDKYMDYIINDRKIYSKHLKNIGIYYAYKGDYLNSCNYLKQALKTNPLNWKNLINYTTIKILNKPAGIFLKSLRGGYA